MIWPFAAVVSLHGVETQVSDTAKFALLFKESVTSANGTLAREVLLGSVG